ncbi:uncharacterized protein METZ01_LOCUS214360, partial [marine metagenome]
LKHQLTVPAQTPASLMHTNLSEN